MLHFVVEEAFDDLLCAWRTHHEVTTTATASVVRRAEVRRRLDLARDRMHELRIAIHPDSVTAEAVVERVWCESLEAVVHLRWADRLLDRPGNFACICGGMVPIDWRAHDLPLDLPNSPPSAR